MPTSASQIKKQYEKILIALQGLYLDVQHTKDDQETMKADLIDIKRTLSALLSYYRDIKTIEDNIFRRNLKS